MFLFFNCYKSNFDDGWGAFFFWTSNEALKTVHYGVSYLSILKCRCAFVWWIVQLSIHDFICLRWDLEVQDYCPEILEKERDCLAEWVTNHLRIEKQVGRTFLMHLFIAGSTLLFSLPHFLFCWVNGIPLIVLFIHSRMREAR